MKYLIISFISCLSLFYFIGFFNRPILNKNQIFKKEQIAESRSSAKKVFDKKLTGMVLKLEQSKNDKQGNRREIGRDTMITLVAINSYDDSDGQPINVMPSKKSSSQRRRDSLIIEEIKDNFGEIISEASEAFNLEPEVIVSLIFVESRGQIFVVSPAGACGLTQLMPGTARYLGINRGDIFDPRQNILGGARYLSENMLKYDDLDLALMAYNRGPAKVDSLLRSGILKSTKYVGDIKYAMTLARIN